MQVVKHISVGMEEAPKKYIFKFVSGSAPVMKSVNSDFSLNFDYMTLIAPPFSQLNGLNTVQNTHFNLFL